MRIFYPLLLLIAVGFADGSTQSKSTSASSIESHSTSATASSSFSPLTSVSPSQSATSSASSLETHSPSITSSTSQSSFSSPSSSGSATSSASTSHTSSSSASASASQSSISSQSSSGSPSNTASSFPSDSASLSSRESYSTSASESVSSSAYESATAFASSSASASSHESTSTSGSASPSASPAVTLVPTVPATRSESHSSKFSLSSRYTACPTDTTTGTATATMTEHSQSASSTRSSFGTVRATFSAKMTSSQSSSPTMFWNTETPTLTNPASTSTPLLHSTMSARSSQSTSFTAHPTISARIITASPTPSPAVAAAFASVLIQFDFQTTTSLPEALRPVFAMSVRAALSSFNPVLLYDTIFVSAVGGGIPLIYSSYDTAWSGNALNKSETTQVPPACAAAIEIYAANGLSSAPSTTTAATTNGTTFIRIIACLAQDEQVVQEQKRLLSISLTLADLTLILTNVLNSETNRNSIAVAVTHDISTEASLSPNLFSFSQMVPPNLTIMSYSSFEVGTVSTFVSTSAGAMTPSSVTSLTPGDSAGIGIGVILIITLICASIWYRYYRGANETQTTGEATTPPVDIEVEALAIAWRQVTSTFGIFLSIIIQACGRGFIRCMRRPPLPSEAPSATTTTTTTTPPVVSDENDATVLPTFREGSSTFFTAIREWGIAFIALMRVRIPQVYARVVQAGTFVIIFLQQHSAQCLRRPLPSPPSSKDGEDHPTRTATTTTEMISSSLASSARSPSIPFPSPPPISIYARYAQQLWQRPPPSSPAKEEQGENEEEENEEEEEEEEEVTAVSRPTAVSVESIDVLNSLGIDDDDDDTNNSSPIALPKPLPRRAVDFKQREEEEKEEEVEVEEAVVVMIEEQDEEIIDTDNQHVMGSLPGAKLPKNVRASLTSSTLSPPPPPPPMLISGQRTRGTAVPVSSGVRLFSRPSPPTTTEIATITIPSTNAEMLPPTKMLGPAPRLSLRTVALPSLATASSPPPKSSLIPTHNIIPASGDSIHNDDDQSAYMTPPKTRQARER